MPSFPAIIPLETLCLKSIVRHFDRICAAYTSVHSVIPKRHFEFLQRMYSKELTKKLFEKGENGIKENYLDFIINKYYKEFDSEYYCECSWESIEERLLVVGEVIGSLTLSKGLGSAAALEKIVARFNWQKFPNLEVISLSRTSVSDENLTLIAKCCPFLKAFNISYCIAVTNRGLMNLKNYSSRDNDSLLPLKCLNVQSSGVNDSGIELVLTQMPTLEVLQYQDVPRVLYNMHEKDFENNEGAVTKTYNLTNLDFAYDCEMVTDILCVCISLCPHVKNLTVTLLTVDSLSLCGKFPDLENVCLTGKGVFVADNRISVNSFLKDRGHQLKSAELCCLSISVSVLAQCCPKLERLDLKDTDFECVDESVMSQLTSLTSFSVEDALFAHTTTLKSVSYVLSHSPNLEIMRLPHSQFHTQDMSMTLLKFMNDLKEIDLSFSDVNLPFLETILVSNLVLEKLNIDYCEHITAYEHSVLLEMVETMRSNVEVVWTEFASDLTYSEEEEYDIYDEYIAYDDDYLGYDSGSDYHDIEDDHHALFHFMDDYY